MFRRLLDAAFVALFIASIYMALYVIMMHLQDTGAI
jgi:hypothetical protein